MKTQFQYQKIWARTLGFLPIIILIYLIQTQFVHNLILSNQLLYISDCLIVLFILSVYYKATQKYTWYIKNGEYWIEENALVFKMNNKLVKLTFSDINEIFMAKTNFDLIGLHHAVLLIKWNSNKIKLVSAPLKKETELYETEFMEIFKIIKTYSPQLKVVKDFKGNNTDYWLKIF